MKQTAISMRRWGSQILTAAICLCGAWQTIARAETAANEVATNATSISVNKGASAKQGAEQPVAYSLEARGGENYLIELHQRGLDFAITVTSPDGQQRAYNSPLKRDEREMVLLENSQAGTYRIVVDSTEPTDAHGRYELMVTRIEPGTGSKTLEALRLMSDAASLYATGARANALQALKHYESAATLWRSLGRRPEEAQALYSIAMLEYWVVYNWARSENLSREAAAIYAELGDRHHHAETIYLQGVAKIEAANELERSAAQGEFEKALRLLQSAEDMHQKLGNAFELARMRNDIGLTYFYKGDWERARSEWGRAAEEFAGLSEWREEGNARQNQAVIDGLQGNNARAIETLQVILDSLPGGRDSQFEAVVLDNLAENQRLFGQFDAALGTYSSALAVHRRIGDPIGEVNSLRGIGNTYYSFGELALASDYLNQALPLAQSANDGRSEEAILSRLGDIAYRRADYTEALPLHEAALAMASADPDRAKRQLRVSKDLAVLNRHAEAQALAHEAEDLARSSSSLAVLADALVQIGNGHVALGAPAKSSAYFKEAAATYELLGLRAGQAEAAHGLANGARALGKLDDAVRYGEASLDFIDSLRAQVAVPELRAVYSAASRSYYETQIDLLMASHAQSPADSSTHLEAALAVSERSRARMVIDLLTEATAGLRGRADSDLLDSARGLYEELAAKRQQRDRLLDRGLKDEESARRLEGLLEAMTGVEKDLHLVEAKLRRTSTAYPHLSPAETLSASQLQAELGSDTVLLQYVLGAKRSHVFAVTAQTLTAAEIPNRQTLQQAVELVVDAVQRPRPDRPAARLLSARLADISNAVLAPVATHLAGKKRLLLALDGALQYIPFAVLRSEIDGVSKPLVETHEIVVVPSLSAVAALRSGRDLNRGKSVAIFADPVLQASDPRLGRFQSESAPPATAPLTRSAAAALSRLPYSALEAEAIADLVPANARHVAYGFQANRDTLISLDLTDYRYVHFATHGLIDARYPALSAIVLSRFDERGNRRNGMLRLYDIFDFELNADLVVLSACNTALGKEIPGEGLVGLAQGFMYAGARSLLVSLWQVSDRATAELMSRFYEGLLNQELAPPEALRAAQMSLAAERRWQHPYYWGAFVVLGDWSQM